MNDLDYYHLYRKEGELEEELDDLTRQRMKSHDESNNHFGVELDHSIALAFMAGIVIGIVLASFLHKFIVHPLGW